MFKTLIIIVMDAIFEPFKNLFNRFREDYRLNDIAIYQGHPQRVYKDLFYKLFDDIDESEKEDYLNRIDNLIHDDYSRKTIVEAYKKARIQDAKARIKKNPVYKNFIEDDIKYLMVADWDWIKENNLITYTTEFPNICKDWRIVLLSFLFLSYKRKIEEYDKFVDWKNTPLLKFYEDKDKGVILRMKKNYGLFDITDDFTLKTTNGAKIYDKVRNTHILIRMVPNRIVELIQKIVAKYSFKIAFRPDYFICGENLKDICYLTEELELGDYLDTIDKIPTLSKLYQSDDYYNALIIYREHNNIYFEEELSDFLTYRDYITTQLVHLQFYVEKDIEYIMHLDHEYVFYTLDEYQVKQKTLTQKGGTHKRYKTFKIDNAKIPFSQKANCNLLYQVLVSYFHNVSLINEYFQKSLIEYK